MGNIKEQLAQLGDEDGVLDARLIDTTSGMTLGSAAEIDEYDSNGAAVTDMFRAQTRALVLFGSGEAIEDMLVTVDSYYLIVRPVDTSGTAFLYVTADRSKSNLALLRLKAKQTADRIEI